MNNLIELTTTIPAIRNSVSRTALRCGVLLVMLTLALGWFALSQSAQAQDGDEGRGNTAEGGGALHTYITTATSAADDTATGSHALFSDTTGNGNTATGDDALFKNTTGGCNTATGISALQATLPRVTIRPTVLVRSRTTQPATITRPPVLVRSLQHHREQQHGQWLQCARIEHKW